MRIPLAPARLQRRRHEHEQRGSEFSDANSDGLWKHYHDGQDKYTYFLLAAAGAAIGYALQKANTDKLSMWIIPFFGAILAWGLSFFFGCKHLHWVQSSLYANFNLLKLQEGSHPNQPPPGVWLEAAMSGVRSALESNLEIAHRYSRLQFAAFIIGASCFVAWRLLAMYRLTAGR